MKDGPGGSEAFWVVDVKNGKGSVTNDAGVFRFFVHLIVYCILLKNSYKKKIYIYIKSMTFTF